MAITEEEPLPFSYGPPQYAQPGREYWAVVVEKRGDPNDERGLLETWIFSPFIRTAGGRVALPRHISDFEETKVCEFIKVEVNKFESPTKVTKCVPRLQFKDVPGFYRLPHLFVRFVIAPGIIEEGLKRNYLPATETSKMWSPDVNAIFVNKKEMEILKSCQLANEKLKNCVVYYCWVSYAGTAACAFETGQYDLGEGPNVHWQMSLRALEQVRVFPASPEDQQELKKCPYLKIEQNDLELNRTVICAQGEVKRVIGITKKVPWSPRNVPDFDPSLASRKELRNFAGRRY